MEVVRLADVAATPWANGAGETRELWLRPSAKGGFDRRISIATLTRPAPFSPLPGIARVLMPIDDVVLRLAIGARIVALTRHACCAFDGAETAALIAIDRPGRVLNVMSRHDAGVPRVDVRDRLGRCDAAVILAPCRVDGLTLSVGDLLIDPRAATGHAIPAASITFA